jgi:hypothetical protein
MFEPSAQQTINLSIDAFFDTYRPVTNHLDDNASYDNCMFETFDAELAFVEQSKPNCIWTIVDADGIVVITNGFQFVNRIGYLITEVPALENSYYDIFDEEDSADNED